MTGRRAAAAIVLIYYRALLAEIAIWIAWSTKAARAGPRGARGE